jgi:uridylate kinase
MSALQIHEVCEDYIRRRAIRHLEKGRVVIFAAGTGNPFFTTDSAAALRAIEIDADVLVKGHQGRWRLYCRPGQGSAARPLRAACFDRVIADKLNVMDTTAVVMCRENHVPIRVFDLNGRGNWCAWPWRERWARW